MTQLSDYFTSYECHIFFGSRSAIEMQQVADFVAGLSVADRAKFRRQLWATHRQRIAARKATRRSRNALGVMLAEMSRERRGER